MKKKRSAKRGTGRLQRLRLLPLPHIRREDAVGPNPRFLKLSEACRYGGFGRTKAYELINSRTIKGVKMGRHTMVEIASIDRFHASLPRLNDERASA
jgi:excisionase family DNA binding protein